MYVCACLYDSVWLRVCVCVCVYVYMCVRACVLVCVCVCVVFIKGTIGAHSKRWLLAYHFSRLRYICLRQRTKNEKEEEKERRKKKT